MPLIPIAASQLRSEYKSLTVSGTLAGAERLCILERLCWNCLDAIDGDQKTVAFALASTFDLLAHRQHGEPIAVDEGQMYFDLFDQPISSCIDFIGGKYHTANPLILLGQLADAYGRLRKAE
jgi:hypothetical protein